MAWREEPLPERLVALGVVRSIAVEDPWPTNLCWRMQLADGRVVVCPVTIAQLHKSVNNHTGASLVSLCVDAVRREVASNGPVPKPKHATAAPDLAERVVGYRVWSVLKGPSGGHRLGAIGSGHNDWRGAEEVEATCARHFHAAPAPTPCHCGWNAWYSVSDIVEVVANDIKVVGAIAGRGRVELHCDGFRCQWARPVAFAYPDNETSQLIVPGMSISSEGRVATTTDRVRALGRELRVPTVPLSRLESFAREHGSPVPAGMRPPPPTRRTVPPGATVNISFSYP